jgi:hypothetical protein
MTQDEMQFFEHLFRSLESEMRQEFADLRREMALLHEKFDRQDARLSRHGGLLNGGARQITRLVEWSEKVDEMMTTRDAKIAEMDARLRKLEGEAPPE